MYLFFLLKDCDLWFMENKLKIIYNELFLNFYYIVNGYKLV